MSEISTDELKTALRKANSGFHLYDQKLYQADELISKEPWLLWEYKLKDTVGSAYTPCDEEPIWEATTRYRRINPQGKPWDLEAYGKLLIILRKNEQGEYEGYCENSWSMDWKKGYALIYMTCSQYSFLGEHKLDAVKNVDDRTKEFERIVGMTPVYVETLNRITKHIQRINKIRDTTKRFKLLKFWNERKGELNKQYKYWEVYDPTDPDCPVTVFLNDWRMAKANRNASKFECRNARFKLKESKIAAKLISNHETTNLQQIP